jgi:hypothetical protein
MNRVLSDQLAAIADIEFKKKLAKVRARMEEMSIENRKKASNGSL